jgi:hypothetical protein
VAVAVAELARVLHIRAPTADQTTAMQRCLDGSLSEVTSFIDRVDPLTPAQQQLVDEVTLERAVEHWQQQESPFGLMGLGGDSVPIYTSRNSFYRHQRKLMSVKQQMGVA